MSPVAAMLDVAGRVEADENRIARVNSPVSGRIVDLEVVEGQTVKRGQVVAVIRSTELTNAQTDFLKAISQRRLADKAVDRAKRLLEAGVIGEAELQRREAEANAQNATKTDIGWGHQIRSYVLQPYQLVKDLRTGVTSTAPGDVLDGALDPFMAAALSQRVTGEKVVVEDVD